MLLLPPFSALGAALRPYNHSGRVAEGTKRTRFIKAVIARERLRPLVSTDPTQWVRGGKQVGGKPALPLPAQVDATHRAHLWMQGAQPSSQSQQVCSFQSCSADQLSADSCGRALSGVEKLQVKQQAETRSPRVALSLLLFVVSTDQCGWQRE